MLLMQNLQGCALVDPVTRAILSTRYHPHSVHIYSFGQLIKLGRQDRDPAGQDAEEDVSLFAVARVWRLYMQDTSPRLMRAYETALQLLPPEHHITPEQALVFANLHYVAYRAYETRQQERHSQVSTYNITSAIGLTQNGAHAHFKLLRNAADKGILFMQETKLLKEDTSVLMSRLPRAKFAASYAQLTSDGKSGGLITAVPKHCTIISEDEPAPGYIHALKILHGRNKYLLLNLYLQPKSWGRLYSLCLAYLTSIPHEYSVIIGGDFNCHSDDRLQKIHDLAAVISSQLHMPTHPTYYVKQMPVSTLDGIIMRQPFDEIASVTAFPPPAGRGHALVSVQLRRRTGCPDASPTGPKVLAMRHEVFARSNPNTKELVSNIESIVETHDPFRNINIIKTVIQRWYRSLPCDVVRTATPTYILLAKQIYWQKRRSSTIIQLSDKLVSRINNELCAGARLTSHHGKCTISIEGAERLRQQLEANHFVASSKYDVSARINETKYFARMRIWKELDVTKGQTFTSLTRIISPHDDYGKVGSIITHPVKVAEAVRHTRLFTCEPSPTPCHKALQLLDKYAGSTAKFPPLDTIDESTYIRAIMSTNNSSPGIDEIPYAAYRLFPDIIARALSQLLTHITLHSPQVINTQLLVWIPKADQGLLPDQWRPLAMPPTLLRMLAASAHIWISKHYAEVLHPAQALTALFKEPQANALNAQDFLTHKGGEKYVLLADLAKAFEWISPKWILLVLMRRGAPNWLVALTRFFLQARQSITKISGRAVLKTLVKKGLDMGNGLSPFLFCVAIDPLVTMLNRVPGVVGAQAYMDDTNVMSEGIAGILSSQRIYAAMKSVGIHVVQHTCASARIVNSGRFRRLKNDVRKKIHAIGTVGIDRLLRAARKSGALFVSIFGNKIIPPKRKLPRRLFDEVVMRHVLRPCKCKSKNAILCNRPININVLRKLDASLWGAKILAKEARCLGLLLTGKTPILPHDHSPGSSAAIEDHRNSPGHARPRTKAAARTPRVKKHHYDKPFAKLKQRANAIKAQQWPIASACRMWSSWAQPVLPYTAHSAEPRQELVEAVQDQFSHSAGVKYWIRKDIAQHLLMSIGVLKGWPVEHALTLHTLSAYFRQFGLIGLSHGASVRTCRIVNILTKAIGHADNCEHCGLYVQQIHSAYDRGKLKQATNSNATIKALKAVLRCNSNRRSRDYFVGRISTAVADAASSWYDLLCKIPDKLLDPHMKIQILALLFDDQYRFARHKDSKQPSDGLAARSQTCRCGCGQPAIYFPNGREYEGTHSYELAAELPMICAPNTTICKLCGIGHGSAHHYLYFCPVVATLFSCHLGVSLPLRIEGDSASFARRVVIAHAVAQVSFYLHSLPSPADLGNQYADTARKLAMIIQQGLPLSYRSYVKLGSTLSRMGICDCNKCPTSTTVLMFDDSSTPLAALPIEASMPILVANKRIEPGEVVDASCNELKLLYGRHDGRTGTYFPPPLRTADGLAANTVIRTDTCTCGVNYASLIAVTHILEGQPVVIDDATSRDLRYDAIVRFDGSTHMAGTSCSAGGAGVVVWVPTDKGLRIICAMGFPQPGTSHSTDAEAHGAARALILIKSLVERGLLPRRPRIRIDGDNAGIIYFQAGMTGLRDPVTVTILDAARRVLLYDIAHVDWKKIPRVHNTEADAIAGIASELALRTGTHDPFCALHLPVIARWRLESPDVLLNNQLMNIEVGNDFFALPFCISKLHESLRRVSTDHKEAIKNICALVTPAYVWPKWITYSTHGLGWQIRPQPVGFAPQRLNKAIRTLLLGTDHWELDAIQATYSIFISRAPVDLVTFPFARSIAAVREWVARFLVGGNDGMKFAKQFLTQLVAGTPDQLYHWMFTNQYIMQVPQPLRDFISHIHDLKPQVLAALNAEGFIGNHHKLEDRNRLTYAIEAVEQAVLRFILVHTAKCARIRSVLPLGDALFFDIGIGKDLVAQVAEQGAHLYGVPYMTFKFTDLSSAVADISAQYAGLQTTHRLPQVSRPGRNHPLLW